MPKIWKTESIVVHIISSSTKGSNRCHLQGIQQTMIICQFGVILGQNKGESTEYDKEGGKGRAEFHNYMFIGSHVRNALQANAFLWPSSVDLQT